MAIFISQQNVNVNSAELLYPMLSLQVAYDNIHPYATSCFMTSDMLFADILFAVRISLCSFCSAIIRFGSLFTRYSIIAVQCFNCQRSALFFLRHLFHSLAKSCLDLHNSFLVFVRCISSTPSCSTRISLQFRFLHIACYANNIPERGSSLRT